MMRRDVKWVLYFLNDFLKSLGIEVLLNLVQRIFTYDDDFIKKNGFKKNSTHACNLIEIISVL